MKIIIAGIILSIASGCVVIGDYRPQVSASIGTGGATNTEPARNPYIADDLQK